jgi:hypothetical protein
MELVKCSNPTHIVQLLPSPTDRPIIEDEDLRANRILSAMATFHVDLFQHRNEAYVDFPSSPF